MRFRNGGELLVEVLRAAGVDTAFGVVSIHNLPLVEAVDARLRFVPVRHEAAAVNAADGYARARRGLGCAITSTGTGAGNAAGSLVEALAAASPVLHVTGQIPTAYLGQGRGFIHETRDQAGMLRAISHRSATIEDAAHAAETLRVAASDALGILGGPVSVEWPIDLQYAPTSADSLDVTPAAPRGVAAASFREALDVLATARRPALWLGGGAVGAGAALTELAERLGAAVFTSNAGRGSVPEDHPLCVGNYATAPAGQALLEEADALLSIGTHFRSNETATYKLRLPVAHIQVDVDATALGRVYPAKVGVRGDAGEMAARLLAALPVPTARQQWADRVTTTRAEVRRRQRAEIGAQAAICDAIRAALPRDGIVARDVTIPSSSWGNRLLPIYDSRGNVFARGGGIGQGLATGIGAALGRPDTPVVVIVGDGGLAVHLGELLTLAQERPNLTVALFNDGGYGVLRNLQEAQGLPRAGVDLHTPDFAALSAAVGLPYRRAGAAATAADVVAAAIRTPGPVLVEVDVAALGAMPTVFTPPVDVPESVGEEMR